MTSRTNNVLVTGGAGFIGREVVRALLDDTNARVAVMDDLSNGSRENLAAFAREPRLREFVKAPVQSEKPLRQLFEKFKPSLCLHLAAQIIVQNSIDDPAATFHADVDGTFHLLELCRAHKTSLLFMSTCMVYDTASVQGSRFKVQSSKLTSFSETRDPSPKPRSFQSEIRNPISAISENHPVLPRSPYAGAKLAGENMCISYYHAYGMPVSVVRPFNTYGPYQKSSGEGGVVSIFLSRALRGEPLKIYGSGEQTRDLLFVGDCAEFVLRAAAAPAAQGRILNAGTGRDVTVNDLADMAIKTVPGSQSKIKHVKHIHPQSEIMKLCCDARLAKKVLGWKPQTKLEKGLALTRDWLETTMR